jgi:hypothetical protein
VSDAEGYGPDPTQDAIGRLLSDARTLGPSGIERIAGAWSRTAGLDHEHWKAAEKAALEAVETANRTATWDSLRGRFHSDTEGEHAMIAWRAEHGPAGHHAESALLGALLGLLVRDRIGSDEYRVLAGPMSAALPWLLPGEQI